MSGIKLSSKHVERIRSLEVNGVVTPDRVLADAKDPASPLHELYNWDVKQAAEAYWLERTREILRKVTVIVTTENRTYRLPGYVPAVDKAPQEQGYVSINHLRVSEADARQAVVNEFDRAMAYMRRARNLAEGLGFAAEVDEIIDRIDVLRTDVESQQQALAS